ncbi:MAG TPA: sigma-54 dependent transcriptional regulator, partial [Geomonas sp.]|nr:sigma-54 dependent transcriptional regulator [Geomonas sp.]
KELIAQAIHYNSPRKEKKFVAINCGALPASLLESELFGYKKGAFTGATENRRGLLETADGGTLFLDEAGNLPMEVQKTLLRFLQEQEFNRIGDPTPTKVDVRVISATNADMKAAVKSGEFREDLFYRLNVVNIHLPPLRERKDDIPLLAAHFIKLQNEKFGTHIKGLSHDALEAAMEFAWPGNIRQLRNVIEACIALENNDYITFPVLSQFVEVVAPEQPEGESLGEEGAYNKALTRFETEYLRGLLRKNHGNVEAAAKEAGTNMATIYRKIKKYGIRKDEYNA